jgi:hypothetical protein
LQLAVNNLCFDHAHEEINIFRRQPGGHDGAMPPFPGKKERGCLLQPGHGSPPRRVSPHDPAVTRKRYAHNISLENTRQISCRAGEARWP